MWRFEKGLTLVIAFGYYMLICYRKQLFNVLYCNKDNV